MTVGTSLQNHTTSPSTLQRRLRVLHVIDSLTVGGAERSLVILARHIDSSRYDLRLCSLAPLRDSAIVSDLRALDIPLYSLGGVLLRDPRPVFRVAALVRRHGIELLHTHMGYGNVFGPLAGLLTQRPVVSTLHNERDAYPRFGTIKQIVQTQVLRRYSRAIIACAPEVRVTALQRLNLPASKLVDIPYGIETEHFADLDPQTVQARRHELLGDSDGPLVVTVGNLKAAKAHEDMVSAVEIVARQVPGVKLAIVGRKSSHEPAVRARIAELGLQDRVILTGQRNDIAELVSAGDLFALSSHWEGLPLALLEAMAAGRPIVSTAVGGIPRVIEDGVTGRLVPPSDIDALARAMTDLLTHPDDARRLADAASLRVRDTYGAQVFAKRTEQVYREVMAGRGGPWTSCSASTFE